MRTCKHILVYVALLFLQTNKKPMIRDANESGSTEKASLPPIEGRVFNSQNPRYENKEARFDISNVDMQEGNMNNGEIGGGIKMEPEVKEPFR